MCKELHWFSFSMSQMYWCILLYIETFKVMFEECFYHWHANRNIFYNAWNKKMCEKSTIFHQIDRFLYTLHRSSWEGPEQLSECMLTARSLCLNSAGGRILFKCKLGLITHSLSLAWQYQPSTSLIWLNYCWKSHKTASHLSIHNSWGQNSV